ncbi:MAG: beta-lactamase family protein, partial [Candidatus Latescibacteria bacterium]|nr:beta-lactamase family protein [Candidatus Latescibacterota bacterium]
MSRILHLLLITTVFSVVNCSQPTPLSPKAQKIADFMVKLEQDGLFNGAVLVAEKGEVIYRSLHGMRSFAPDKAFQQGDAFRIGSISKPFTAVAVHMLVEQGKLSYDDALSRFFPELPYNEVTIGNLLSHTSGLYDVYEEIEMREAFYTFYGKLTPPYTNKDYLAYMIEMKPELIGGPLELDRYTNTGYVLLGLIVEQLSEQRFDAFLKERIFDPSGMSRTGIVSLLDGSPPEYVVGSYRLDAVAGIQPTPDPNVPRSVYGLTYGDDEMYTTMDDLFAFDLALRSGRLLKPESLARMMAPPTLNNGRAARYGQGFNVRSIGGNRYVSHTGSTYSFLSYWQFGQKDSEPSVILFSNVRSQRNTFLGVYSALNKILADEPFDPP